LAELLGQAGGPVVAIYAHPDDADLSCGGTLARWAADGVAVHLVVCTDGAKGTGDAAVEPETLAARRAVEMEEAARRLGITAQHHLGYPDGELGDLGPLRAELVAMVRRLRPHTVLCPDPTAVFFGEDYYNHRDHRALGFAALDALSPASALPHYYPEAGAAHQVDTVLMSGTLEPTVWVDISSVIDDKVAAVACHRSQFGDDGEWALRAVRLRAEEEGRVVGVPFAEGFRRLRLGG
jgi:LmbE family N-acetylglucosaminyl deacetylase